VSTLTNTSFGPTSFLSNIREFVKYSYYDRGALKVNDDLPPAIGVTVPRVDYVATGTGGRYSWLKAPRFGTTVCEVGPVARMVISYATTNPAVVTEATGVSTVPVTPLGGGVTYDVTSLVNFAAGLLVAPAATTTLVSILGRHACRALECKLVADAMADTQLGLTGQSWLSELKLNSLTSPVYVYAKLPTKPKSGAGWAEAPRGALGHWISIENKRIKNYQCVVPSTWNHSPMDSNGLQGACEQVLTGIGTYAAGYVASYNPGVNDDLMITALRILHTYDFCIACAVHMVRPDGSTITKFKMDLDGSVTRLPHDAEI